jgi:hypothetical protein
MCIVVNSSHLHLQEYPFPWAPAGQLLHLQRIPKKVIELKAAAAGFNLTWIVKKEGFNPKPRSCYFPSETTPSCLFDAYGVSGYWLLDSSCVGGVSYYGFGFNLL